MHQLDVFGPAAVVVARHVAGLAQVGAPGSVGEAVPDARPRPVGERRAFDLVSGSGGPPEKTLGEGRVLGHGAPERDEMMGRVSEGRASPKKPVVSVERFPGAARIASSGASQVASGAYLLTLPRRDVIVFRTFTAPLSGEARRWFQT